MSSKWQLSQGLEHLLDAISSLDFKEKQPYSQHGETLGQTPEAKGKAKQESSPTVWVDIPVPISHFSCGASLLYSGRWL
jgi:hypothetical protein